MTSRAWKSVIWAVALILVSGTLVASASSQAGSAPTAPNPLCSMQPCAPMISGWLHTELGNTGVYNGNGSAVPLLGVDVDGLDFGTGNPATSPDSCGKGWGITASSYANVAAWGFNSVRIPISWENIEPTSPTLLSNGTWVHHWNTAYIDELDSVVKQFGSTHVAVIFDFAQVDLSAAFQQAPEQTQGGECEGWGNPIWLYPGITSPSTSAEIASAMCSFFNDRSLVGAAAPAPIEAMEAAEQMLASRYASNPTVIGIDMFNEPWFNSSCGSLTADGDLLTSFYTKMGDAIEAVNPHLLVAFEEPPPGLVKSSPIISSAPAVPNALYEFHIYTSDWSTAQPYVKAFLGNARAWGVPLWMGEFDAFEAGSTGSNSTLDPNWQADTQSLLAYCNANGINWAYFSYFSLGTNVQTPVAHPLLLALLRGALPETAVSTASTTSSSASTATSTSTESSTTSSTLTSLTTSSTTSMSSSATTSSTSAGSSTTTSSPTSSSTSSTTSTSSSGLTSTVASPTTSSGTSSALSSAVTSSSASASTTPSGSSSPAASSSTVASSSISSSYVWAVWVCGAASLILAVAAGARRNRASARSRIQPVP
ncbi:MAG: cellulase family glycosylhydrolase [Nitrososphaerales archaeon]